ncbi:MAG: hypothetical protein ABNH26_14180 [Celeribacter sp.]
MKIFPTCSSALALACAAFGTPVAAQACDPQNPNNGDTVVCDGSGGGVDYSGVADLDVTVSGQIVAATGDGFIAGDNLTLVNQGLLETQASPSTLLTAGDGAEITNDASMVVAGGNGAMGIDLGDDSSFWNSASGTLSGGSYYATGSPLRMGDNATVQNDGLIETNNANIAIGLGEDAAVTNTGRINVAAAAIYAGSGLSVFNSGEMNSLSSPGNALIFSTGALEVINTEEGVLSSGTNSSAIQSNGGTLTLQNDGQIVGSSRYGITAQNATIRNGETGVIKMGASTSYGISTQSDLDLVNEGLIESTSGASVQAFGTARIINSGVIRKTTDSFFGTFFLTGNSEIVNSGTIEGHATLGHLMLMGQTNVVNSGTIQNLNDGSGAAIWLSSPSPDVVHNSGTISGYEGIVDRSASADSHDLVVNYGTIIGTGGTALDLAQGDDTLVLHSLDIQGDVIFGEGNDTLILAQGTRSGVLTFGDDLENVELSAHSAAIYSDNTLVVADAGFFGDMDTLRAFDARSLGVYLTDPLHGSGWWASAGVDLRGNNSGDNRMGNITLGRDFDQFGVFVSATRGQALGDDGLNEATYDSLLAGVRGTYSFGEETSLTGAIYAGHGETEFSGTSGGAQFGETDNRFVGLAAGLETSLGEQVTLTGRAGVEKHEFDGFSLSSLNGAEFGSRDMLASYIDVEASMRHELASGIAVSPFIGASLLHASADSSTMSYMGETIPFETDDSTVRSLTLGAELQAQGLWNARVETRFSKDRAMEGGVSFAMRF